MHSHQTTNKADSVLTDVAYRAMFEANQSINLVVNTANMHIIDVNPAATRYYGYTRAEMRGMSLPDICMLPLEEIQARLASVLTQDKETQYTPQAVCNHRLSDGTIRKIEALPSLLTADSDEPLMLMTVSDVTERIAMEERLRRSEDMLQDAARLAKVGGWELDLRTNTLYWDAETKRIHEVPEDYEPYLETAINFYAQEARQRIGELVRLGIEEQIPWDVELPFITATGRKIWVRAIGKAVVEDGATVKLFGVFQDITDQRMVQDALSRSEARYRDVVQVQTELVCRYLPDTTITFVNDAYCDFFGRDAADLIDQTILSLVDADRRKNIEAHLQTIMNADDVVIYQHQIQRGDGELCWLEWADQVVRDDNGDVIEIQAVGRDITARKRMEQQLKESEARYRLLARNLPDISVLLFDEDLRFLIAEGPVLAAMGYDINAFEGRTLREAVSEAVADVMEPRYRAALDGQEISYEFTEHNGRIYSTHLVSVTYADRPAGMLMMTDITERKQAEQQQLALVVAKERVNFLTEFITIASHEFRTPLAIINSCAYLIRRTEDVARRNTQLERIEAQVERITMLVDKLLEMIRVYMDNELKKRPTHVNSLVRQAVDSMDNQINAQELQLMLDLDPKVPTLHVDQVQIVRALEHLLDNAVRFNRPGKRLIVTTDTITDDERPHVRVTITDEGIGMDEATRSRLFDGFYRHDLSHATPGFGLGASITRRIIDMHGGSVSAESTPDKGSTITVLLPVQADQE